MYIVKDFPKEHLGGVRMLENDARKILETNQSFFKGLGTTIGMHK